MKKLLLLLLGVLLIFCANAQDSEFLQFLKTQSIIQSIEKIDGNKIFQETYLLLIKQPIDHEDSTQGFFNQRVYVSHKSKESPVVLITEGYVAAQSKRAMLANELSILFGANQIDVEHRYFGQSWPKIVDWKFLTVQNSAADHNRITQLFKKYYSGKWVNTGISKGGQTAIFHRAFYPDDVDVTVAYVAPLNFGIEDGRHEPFIANYPGTLEQREKISTFQMEILKRRNEIFPMVEKFIDDKKFTFRVPSEEVFDYCVLEYSFSFWQWGINPDIIPGIAATNIQLFEHLLKYSNPDYFAIEGMENIKSFFYQAAHELGYYGYNTKFFKKYLKIKSAKNYLSKIFLPPNENIKYRKSTMLKVNKFIQTTDKNIVFIYGEFDPWSATAVDSPIKNNLLKITNPGGSHKSRIENLPILQKNAIYSKFEKWLNIEIGSKSSQKK